jgi:hypothetical protein
VAVFFGGGRTKAAYFDRATGRRIRTRPLGGLQPTVWLSRNHVLMTGFDEAAPATFEVLNVKTGRIRPVPVTGRVTDVDGRHVLLGGLEVVTFGARGGVRQRIAVPPLGENYVTGRIDGDRVLVSPIAAPQEHALVTLDYADGTATSQPLDLAGGVYDWVTPTVLATDADLAKIDRGTSAVVREVQYAQPLGVDQEPVTPFEGGAVIGLARERYDADLNLVATNPEVSLYGGPAFIRGDRIYGRRVPTLQCGFGLDPGPPGTQIADVRTGAVIRQFSGGHRLGLLGSGYLTAPNDDDCD